jgi:hypothetical protein
MNEIEKAKETLRQSGYYVENLWSIYDVDDDSLNNEEKLEVLHNAIHRDYIYERINESIQDELLILSQFKINDHE